MIIPQTKAIADANLLISLCTEGMSLYTSIMQLQASWAVDGTSAMLNAMSTAAIAADGSLSTADITPNPAHPIDVRVYTSLNRAVTAAQLEAALEILGLYVNCINGQPVAATPNIPATLLSVTYP